jgi:hypothetical protein
VNYITSVERVDIQKGEAAIIMRLMQHRFGNIPEVYEQRIQQADANTLLSFGEKILEAKTLEDLFKDDNLS